jgi:hypothetical protein
MIYKEFKDIYKQVLIVLSFLMIIPIIHYRKFSSSIELSRTGMVSRIVYNNEIISYFFIFAFIVFILADVLGKSMFNSEFKDNGFEYMLSMPLSKLEILRNKVIPRVIILFSLIIVYAVIFNMYIKDPSQLNSGVHILVLPKYMSVLILFSFIVSVSLSIFKSKNWIALIYLLTAYIIFSLPFSIKVILRAYNVNFKSEVEIFGYSFIIGFIIIIMILGSGFTITFNKFDLREKWRIGNGFSKIIIPIETVIIIMNLVILLN